MSLLEGDGSPHRLRLFLYVFNWMENFLKIKKEMLRPMLLSWSLKIQWIPGQILWQSSAILTFKTKACYSTYICFCTGRAEKAKAQTGNFPLCSNDTTLLPALPESQQTLWLTACKTRDLVYCLSLSRPNYKGQKKVPSKCVLQLLREGGHRPQDPGTTKWSHLSLSLWLWGKIRDPALAAGDNSNPWC